jgi:glycosyltransferase involved in cell wall biosynthesis
VTTVLHLTHTCVPEDARILRELNALSREPGLEVHAFGVLGAKRESALKPYKLKEFRVLSAGAKWLPRPLRYALVMFEANLRFAFRLWKLRPDIVHCHDTMVLPAGVLAKLAVRSILIYDAHELESNKSGQNKALSWATLAIEKISWPRIDHLITVGPAIASWYHEHLGSKPSTCIFNSPEVPVGGLAHPGVPGLREQVGLGLEMPLFVYVGAFATGRGIEVLLETFFDPDLHGHVAFVGSGDLLETIKGSSEVHHNIHYVPQVPHYELVGFIQEATAGFCLIEDVSLSDYYCLPNKLFEYAFAGLPIIASRLPEIDRFVKEYQLGVCADLDPDSIKQAVKECMALPRNLSADRLQPLSWLTQAQHLKNLYSKLLLRKPIARSK